jgi:hypothetical protein
MVKRNGITTEFKVLGHFLIIKPTICTDFSNVYLEWNSTCFGQFLCPSSKVFYCTHGNGMSYRFADNLRVGLGWNILILLVSCQYTCMTYIAVCTVKNFWWWTEELSETCRVSFQVYIREISAYSWFHYKKFNTMHGHRKVKFWAIVYIYFFISIQPLGPYSRNQSPVRRPVWLWHAASWASS